MADAMTTPGGLRLGRLPRRKAFGAGKLWLHDYLGPLLAVEPPKSVDYTAKAPSALKRMYCNDRLGCCVMSGAMHAIGVWTGNADGAAVEATDDEVQKQYFHLSGGRDSGLVISDMLDYMRDHGIVAGGQTYWIDDYLAVDHTNPRVVKWGIYIFGNAKVGLNLPGSWEDADVWDVANAGRFVGGHDVEFFGYGEDGSADLSTWGTLRKMTPAAIADRRIIDEMYFPLSRNWEKNAPNGLDLSTLKADLQAIRDGKDPIVTPTPPPYVDPFGGL